MNFGAEIRAISAKMMQSVDRVQRSVTIDLFNSVIDDTRVDTGRARGNWQTTSGEPAAQSLLLNNEDRNPSLIQEFANNAKSQIVENYKPRSLMIIANNLVYIGKLEELDGMIDRNVARIGRVIREKSK